MPPLNLTAANATASVITGDLIASALLELNAYMQGEPIPAEDSQWGLENLQRRIDLINAQRQLIYAETFELYTLLTNTAAITIGPAGNFNRPYPPIWIPSWGLILPGGTAQTELTPLPTLSEGEWAAINIKTLTSTLPNALYYQRDFPLGKLYFWPIPTQANQVRLRIWNNLPQALNLQTALALPPGYWMYLLCALTSDMAPSYGPQAAQMVQSQAFRLKYSEALNAIKDNNQDVPPLTSGVPSSRGTDAIPDFNFLTGIRQ